MRFPPGLLDEIRARLPVSEVVGRRVKLKKQGREWRGLSPFNKERTPSFFVNDQKGFYHDFSAGKHGDIFKFVMETEGWTFPEAVERLAAMAGVTLPKISAEADAQEQRRRTLHDVLELATKFFEGTLASKEGARARGYLADRGVHPSTQLEFRIGYAPASRFALKEHLASHGISNEDMIEAGLLVAGEDIPVPYDRFRDRVIIPIADQRGRIVAFGGRTLNNDVQPKYLNSPETPVFHKGAMVFNFHRARQAAHDAGSVVVVEGYMDAIAIYQAGLKSVVASMGTAFTDEQISTLWRLSNEPVVCFDSDRAGISAAYRSVDRILPNLTVGRTFRFAFMREEKDPDDLIRERGIEAFRSVLAGSLQLWEVLWTREAQAPDVDVRSPDAQAALEKKLYSIVRTIKDPAVQTAYLRTCRMELADLFWQVARSKRGQPDKGLVKTGLKIEREGRRNGIQKVLLGLLVHYPDFVDEKSDEVSQVEFTPRLEEFRKALYDLLIMYKELSVQSIYDQLKPVFYEVLEEIHGERTDRRPWGHRLFERFPILRSDPPRDYIARCIEHFCRVLRVDQMEEEIERLGAIRPDASPEEFDEASVRLLDLVRDFQVQDELNKTNDIVLAEEAKDMARVWGPPADWKVAA